MSESEVPITRRRFVASGTALTVGAFAPTPAWAAGQDAATPQPVRVAHGYVSTRLRSVEPAEARADINEVVLEEFIPEVRLLEGYAGYLLGNVIDNDAQSLSVVVLREPAQAAAFDEFAEDFVDDLGALVESVDTTQWEGSLLISGTPAGELATPVTEPEAGVMREGLLMVRGHRATVGTSPVDFIPLGIEDFVARMEALEGFRGYLWYPTDDGYVSVSLFDAGEPAEAAALEAIEREAELLADYTAGDPEIYNAAIVWAELSLPAALPP